MIRDQVIKALQKATGEKGLRLEIPEVREHGDYSSNIALVLAKKRKKRPRDLANEIIKKLKKDRELAKIVSKIEVAGPGFINFWLSKETILDELRKVLKLGEKYGSSNLGKNKTVVIDYSSPNIAKRFGIGHMRSTIIGQALYNLYSFLGYKVIGDNHLGDWGTQFGALLAQIRNSNIEIRNLDIEKLEKLYVEFNKKAQDNPKLWDEARAWFKKLEDGDKGARKIWKQIVEISKKEFERIYDLLGIKIDKSFGESFYEDKMKAIVDELCQKGLSKKSKGAEIVEFDDLPPAMLIKSDYATTYYTRDLATVKFRVEKFKPDIIIYEVGSEQKLHFKQVFATAGLMGWLKTTKLVHVAHGLIRFKEGKMSTRRGQSVMLEDILDESIKRAKKIIEKSEMSRGLPKKEKDAVAKTVGIGAIKYFDLSHHYSSDIIFDWEKMFVLEGNSAPYLQYTHVRTQSVLRKANGKWKVESGKLNSQFSNFNFQFNKEELAVLRSLVHFPEVIEDCARAYSPNLLCNYLFGLAQKYNTFYNQHRILPSQITNHKSQITSEFRLALTSATGQTLKNGLKLLGIETPRKM